MRDRDLRVKVAEHQPSFAAPMTLPPRHPSICLPDRGMQAPFFNAKQNSAVHPPLSAIDWGEAASRE
jgi:hypothetical protein